MSPDEDWLLVEALRAKKCCFRSQNFVLISQKMVLLTCLMDCECMNSVIEYVTNDDLEGFQLV